MRTIEITFLGPSGAGKSELVRRLVINDYQYQEHSDPTPGAHFLTYAPLNSNVKLKIWDTGGSPRYLNFIPMYTQKARKLCLIISADNLLKVNEILQYLPPVDPDKNVDVQLIITKKEIDTIQVNKEYIDALFKAVKAKGYVYLQEDVLWVSAKENKGIDDLRKKLTKYPESPEIILPKVKPIQHNTFPSSYRKITSKKGLLEKEERVIALLKDYTKGTTPVLSSLSLIAHGHFNRSHTSLVRTMLRELEKNPTNIFKVLDELKNMKKNPAGSLARRLNYIDAFFGGSVQMETLNDNSPK